MTIIKIGIIGGSGLSDPNILVNAQDVKVSTEFGDPSDILREGTIEGVPCVLLARHGRKHTIMPSNVNFRANILALKKLGCTHVLVSTACGSLKDAIKPGHMVILDQFIDRTTKRHSTFYDGTTDGFKGILHIPMASPFCSRTRNLLIKACQSFGYANHTSGTIVTIEGPRFSSKAESIMFKKWGGDVINMTTVPEVVLANELGLCYASIAMATDYDCWKDSGESVNVAAVMETMKSNSEIAVNVLKKTVSLISQEDWTDAIQSKKMCVESNVM